MCVGGVVIGVSGVLGGGGRVSELLCGGCAGWWTRGWVGGGVGGSEDRTSLRGVAVNP